MYAHCIIQRVDSLEGAMLDAVTQAPIATVQNLAKQEDSLQQSLYAHIILNADLQARADIIIDTTGKYSDADKIKAYTDVYNADHALSDNPSTGEGGDASLQRQAFDRAIKDSTIGKAIIDGNLKKYAYNRGLGNWYGVGGNEKGDAAFFNSLSDLQKQ